MLKTQDNNLMDTKEFNICLDKIRSGDKSAIRLIYDAFGDLMFKIALWIVENTHDANDIVQDFFKYILENIETIKYVDNPKGWIAVSIRYNSVRCVRRKSRNANLDEYAFENESSYVSDVDLKIMIKESKELLADLEREIFELHYVQGYKGDEVAKMLGRPHGTIRRDFSKIRAKLKHLKKYL